MTRDEHYQQLLDESRAVMKLLDDGWLVRSTERDSEPGWFMRQVGPLQTLQRFQELCATEPEP